MIKSAKNIIGCSVRAGNDNVGNIRDIYIDGASYTIRYIVIDTGLIFSKCVLVSPFDLGAEFAKRDNVLKVHVTKNAIKNAPDIDFDKCISRKKEEELRLYYKWPLYWKNTEAKPIIENGDSQKDKTGKQSERNLRSFNEISKYRIHAQDGDIGTVEDMICDVNKWQIVKIKIGTYDWLKGKKVLISCENIRSIEWEYEKINIKLTREKIKEYEITSSD